jgi:hypothetical protein
MHLTYRDPDGDKSGDRPSLEISPAMESAGITVLEGSGYLDQADSGFHLLARQVFEAMWLCHQHKTDSRIQRMQKSSLAGGGRRAQIG